MPYLIAALAVALLAALSILAEKRWRMHARLPMQWGFHGQVNWTAPRRIALAFTPALAAAVLFGTIVLSHVVGNAPPGVVSSATAFGAAAFLFAHVLHLGLLARWHARR